MAYCGEKYQHLIRGVSGQTREDPCGWYCNLNDWQEWKSAMESMRSKVYAKFAELQRQATNAGRADVADEVTRLYIGPADNAYAQTLAVEPSAVDAFPGDSDIAAAITKAIETMDLYACALEQVDKGYVELGLETPETPGGIKAPPPKSETDWGSLAKKAGIALGVGFAGYMVVRIMLTRRAMHQQQLAARPTYTPPRPASPPPPPPTANWSAM